MKQKGFVILIILVLFMVGCEGKPDELISEDLNEIEIKQETKQDLVDEMDKQADNEELNEKLSTIGFEYISGQFTRKIIQDEEEFTEMIALDRNSFLRIAKNELEQEVFAYNYKSDDFTYLYYFEGELLSKTQFNIETGAILSDDEGYAELLDIDSKELKLYFSDLIALADLDIEKLIK